ncbi:syntaxin-binding protein [Achlya hypogyna]|uniref:Syntaxin-binding protein n=1 Tax=Achlya hypogyna TaxID=1202772 RepID=A0A1V9YQC1_ACHHY|nr:syntaxin-binding protein [Achlya hypogyna]
MANLRTLVQTNLLEKMIKATSQASRGWVVLVLDDATTAVASMVLRMTDLTERGVSIVERLELARQPFPEMAAIYFIEPTVASVNKLLVDFAGTPMYATVHVFFSAHADAGILDKFKACPALLARLRTLKEANVDFLAVEKAAFSLDMPNALYTLYSPHAGLTMLDPLLDRICAKLVTLCATTEEYPYVRYKAGQPKMEVLARRFQAKMNEYVANNAAFAYCTTRSTLLFVERAQDQLCPLVHEVTYQAMVYDLLDGAGLEGDAISYPADTQTGTVTKQAMLDEHDVLWTELRHTHIAEVSKDIGGRMAALSASNAGTSLQGKGGKAPDVSQLAAALRELPEFRDTLAKLSQHLYLAGKTLDEYTKHNLLGVSTLEQSLATGVDEAGKKIKLPKVLKDMEELLADPKIPASDKARLLAVFVITQDAAKDADRKKLFALAQLPAVIDKALHNMKYLGVFMDKIAVVSNATGHNLTADEIKDAAKKATTSEYATARYEPKLKSWMDKLLKKTLDPVEFPYVIAPPPGTPAAAAKREPTSLRKKIAAKVAGKTGADSPSNKDACVGERLIVFVVGGATYSELRSVYDLRERETRDVILGATSFLRPKGFLESLVTLDEPAPPVVVAKAPAYSADMAPVHPSDVKLTDIHTTQ